MTTDIATTIERLTLRREEGSIKPRQYDMVVRELMRTVADSTRRSLTAEPEPPVSRPEDTAKYPNIVVPLVNEDANAFSIASRVRGALKRAGVSEEECAEYFNDALSGDYTHVLTTTLKWVNVNVDSSGDEIW